MPRLTKRLIDSFRPDGCDRIVWDSEIPGFGLRLLPSGKRAWLIQYRTQGRTRRYTLGACTVLTPHESRKKAARLLARPRRSRGCHLQVCSFRLQGGPWPLLPDGLDCCRHCL